MIQCPICQRDMQSGVELRYRHPTNPAHDQFRCAYCEQSFTRYSKPSQDRIDNLSQKLDDLAHVIIEHGIVPGAQGFCRCDQCRRVAQSMDNAGYLSRVSDRWWESK